MRFTRSTLTFATLVGLLVGTTSALAGPASAAPDVTPQAVCGSGYKIVNETHINLSKKGLGTVYLTYNRTTGKNCVTTIRDNPGTPVHMSGWIKVSSTGESGKDIGWFRSHAGPVYVYGKGYCVTWGGQIENVKSKVQRTNCGTLKE